jgi:hypothetical protein
MKRSDDKVKLLFSVGGLLIITIAITLLIVTLGFFAGVTVSKWQFPAGFLISAGLYHRVAKPYYSHFRSYSAVILICLGLIISSVIIATKFYDVSYDGQSYHMEEIYQLKNGWNPAKGELADSVNMALYIDHYSKGVEIPQSTLYSLTEHIESGKATNLILLIASFCLTLALLLHGNKLSGSRCILISLFTALNPVAVNQLLTTYVDGQLAIMLLCFVVVAIRAISAGTNFSFLLLASIVIITANIKFTGLVYIVLFSFAFLTWLAVVNYQKLFFRKAFLVTLFSGLVAVLIVGYSTYVENTIVHNHPFYPLMGENKVDIMQHNLPPGFEDYSAATKFFLSLFSHSENAMVGNNHQVQLKIPFTFNKDDVINSYAIDTRIAGFGAMFSGLIMLSVILILVLLIKYYDRWKYRKNWLYLMGLIIISIVVMPESWWARYVPQFWYLPILVLLMSELYMDHQLNIFKLLMYLCLVINVSFTLLSFRYNFMMSRLINAQLKEIKDSNQRIFVQFNSAESNRIRFQENGISYVEKYIEKNPASKSIINSAALYLIPTTHSNRNPAQP